MAQEVLSFRYPRIDPQVSGNQESYVSINPSNPGVFRSDQNAVITFNCSSTSQFLKTIQSYLSLTITPRAADGSAIVSGTTTNSTQGASRVIDRLVIRAGATVLESISSYNDLVGNYLSQLTTQETSVLAKTEGVGVTNYYAGGAKKSVLPIWSSLFVTPQCLPICLAVGGISIDIFLAPVSSLFTSSNVIYYTCEAVFQAMMLTPPASYTVGLTSAIRSGRAAHLAMTKISTYRMNGNGSMTQRIVLPIGNVSSVDSIRVNFWDQTAYSVTANDKALRYGNANLTSYRIEGAGLQWPAMLKWTYGANDPELLYMNLLTRTGSVFDLAKEAGVGANWDTQQFSINHNFTSNQETFGSGVNLLGASSPNISIVTEHSANVPSTTNITVFVATSQIVTFTGTTIEVSEVF